jgi:hypothetical protein
LSTTRESQVPLSNYSFNSDNGLIQLLHLLFRVHSLLTKLPQRDG